MSRQRDRLRRYNPAAFARTPGFDAMPNRRIVAALLQKAAELQELGWDAVKAFEHAWHQVARLLPRAPTAKVLRAPRPSRSDEPHYRKACRPASCDTCLAVA